MVASLKKWVGGETHAPTRCLSINFKALVHLMNKVEELNRIEIKDRFRLSLKSIQGEVAGHHEKV
jgi:hypothetical protein